MKTLRCLLVDDEPPARKALSLMLREVPGVEVAGTAADGMEALELLSREQVDLLFLDIEMPGLTGMELAARLCPAIQPAVIFVTAWPRYAVGAFEVRAADYLLKPVEPGRLAAAVQRARERLAEAERDARISDLEEALNVLRRKAAVAEPDHLWVSTARGRVKLALEDVERVCADGDYVEVHTAERSYLMRESLHALAARLPAQRFVRVHRSTLVNLAAVARVTVGGNGQLELTTRSGARVKVGRRARHEVRRVLGT